MTGFDWGIPLASGPLRTQAGVTLGEDFELDLQSYKLRRAGRVLKLERIPMEILLLLVERRNQIVTREQIAAKIWGKNVFLDTDNSINGAIRKIRQVLRDDSEQPRFIQTISGSGYRFIAPISDEASRTGTSGTPAHQLAPVEDVRQTADAPGRPLTAGTTETPQSKPQIRSRRLVVYIALSFLLVAGVAGWFMWSRSRAPLAVTGKIMLAVLPFQNLTGDASQEYFSDGLTEEMITQLGNLDPQHLGVIARTSVMHYKTTQTPLDQVSRELGVQYVIEGSVRRDANNVRITAQLIQAKDQTHVWARQYDRELKGLLTLQGEIAQEIADEIQLTLGERGSVVAKPTSPQDYEAYDLYLKGQYFLNKRNGTDLGEAINYFQQAVARDPNYARAYAGLADCYTLMGGYSQHPQSEFTSKARAAALQALQIDDNLSEAHTALALIVQNYDWDWQTAEKEFRRAIDLNPNYATAHHWYAEHLMWRGRFNEALQESERARQLDPLSLIVAADNGAILYFSRQYDGAIAKWRSVLQMDPEFRRAHLIRAAYVEKGMYSEAIADTERMRPEVGTPMYWSWLTIIYGRSGQSAQAHHALQVLLQSNLNYPIDPMMVAWAYVALRDKDQAFAWFEKAYAQHSTELLAIKVSPACDPLRGDPRFQDLLRRTRLAN